MTCLPSFIAISSAINQLMVNESLKFNINLLPEAICCCLQG